MNKTLINLILFFAELLHKNADEKIKAIKNLQQENKDKLLNEIAAILLNYNISDSSLDINLVERKKLYSKLVNLINESIGAELEFEKTTMKDVLKDTGFNKYNSTSYLYSLNVSYDVMPVKEKELDKIINTTIDGKSWSERLYDNKDTICKELKVNINKFLKGEINTNDIGKVLNSKYDVNSYNSDRLIRTEVTRVQAQTNELWAKKHDVQYQLFMATLDHKTSKRCRGYDGKVYSIDDANKPIPPLHPNCRSDLISIPNKDWRPKGRFDNLNKKNINWQTYEEWLKENKKPLTMNLQLFGGAKSNWKLLQEKIERGLIDNDKFEMCYDEFNKMFKDGVKTPLENVKCNGTTFAHIAQRHNDMVDLSEIRNIKETLTAPHYIYETTDKNGFIAKSYLKTINGETLLVATRGDIISAYYPNRKYLQKNIIDGGKLLWENK